VKETAGQFVRFGVVGVMNVAINAGFYALLVWLGAHYILASAVGTVLGILNSFVWSKFFVFRAKGDAGSQFGKTLLVYAGQVFVSWTGLAFWIEVVRLDPYLAYVLNVVFVTAASFLGLKYVAFATRN
jgi:putative flippase GtrA